MRYENLCLDEERALYGLHGAEVVHCTFAGPADGESALKECRNLRAVDCRFDLRYPLWHVQGGEVINCQMGTGCRAPMWYDERLRLQGCRIEGVKALRECADIHLSACEIHSPEFGWQCQGLTMEGCELASEYAFLHSRDLRLHQLRLEGKYSFQYVENAVIRHCTLLTKDAFWHSRNITVEDSIVRGEYLGWYSQNLRLVRCKLAGTQPLCYAKGLVLENCERADADLAFEYSDVQATVHGEILSVKNPAHGRIEADAIGEIILDEHRAPDADCQILCRQGRE